MAGNDGARAVSDGDGLGRRCGVCLDMLARDVPVWFVVAANLRSLGEGGRL
jgi:hypothetical protein